VSQQVVHAKSGLRNLRHATSRVSWCEPDGFVRVGPDGSRAYQEPIPKSNLATRHSCGETHIKKNKKITTKKNQRKRAGAANPAPQHRDDAKSIQEAARGTTIQAAFLAGTGVRLRQELPVREFEH
jgi:hypothetical protein